MRREGARSPSDHHARAPGAGRVRAVGRARHAARAGGRAPSTAQHRPPRRSGERTGAARSPRAWLALRGAMAAARSGARRPLSVAATPAGDGATGSATRSSPTDQHEQPWHRHTGTAADQISSELEAILEAKPVEITCRYGRIGMSAVRKLLKTRRHRNPDALHPVSGPGGRWFKSTRPDHSFQSLPAFSQINVLVL
jgi:hypothetical protein